MNLHSWAWLAGPDVYQQAFHVGASMPGAKLLMMRSLVHGEEEARRRGPGSRRCRGRRVVRSRRSPRCCRGSSLGRTARRMRGR
eukprot:948303-Heterocapsa_arctica.AAC.1